MTLRMKRKLASGDLLEKVGRVPVALEIEAAHPEGVDLSTEAGRTELAGLQDEGLAAEFVAAAVFDAEQRQRFVAETVSERMALLGVTTQEEVAALIPPLAERTESREEETAVGIMLDLNGDDVLRAARAAERAAAAFESDGVALKARLKEWVGQEVEAAAQAGRLTP